MPVAIDIGPDLDALSDDAFHRKAAAVDQRIDIFNMENPAGCGALDSLSCFVHGDAIDMETTSRFGSGKRDAAEVYIYQAIRRALVPRERRGRQRVKHGYPVPASREFRNVPERCVQTACRMDLFTKAK